MRYKKQQMVVKNWTGQWMGGIYCKISITTVTQVLLLKFMFGSSSTKNDFELIDSSQK